MSSAPQAAAPPPRSAESPAREPEQRVTPLELFFDLVFVFAITQVTGFVTADPTWMRLLEALALMTVLWWAWSCFAWLGNTAASEDGLFRAVLLAAMAAMLVAAIAVPGAFAADALAFGIAYALVRVLHIAAYVRITRGDPDQHAAMLRLARPMLAAGGLILLAGLLGGGARTACWVAAITIDVAGLWFFGVEGWRVEASHLGERHGLIIIIALGESIVAVGAGAQHVALHAGPIAGVLLGFAVAAALWWAYFDIVALVAERRFRRAQGRDRVLIARDSYTYLHFPMVAGIVLFAVGAKQTLAHVGDPLGAVPATALGAGVALYFAAHVAFRWRNVHRLNVARVVAAGLLVALVPLATVIPALAALGAVAAICCGVIAYEHVRYHELRERLRRQIA